MFPFLRLNVAPGFASRDVGVLVVRTITKHLS
jgi:hypothetical protein